MDNFYHYCSTQSFESIISNQSIRLSSLTLSNDTMEGRLLMQTFERLFAESDRSEEDIEKFREAISFIEDMFDGLGFCLSEKPDLLSQWRGYANDGQGFCIGFNKKYLEELSDSREKGEPGFLLEKVLYSPDEHANAIRPTFDEFNALIETGKLNKPVFGLLDIGNEEERAKKNEDYSEALKSIWKKAVKTYKSVYVLKNQAFSEEAEWRLISYFAKESKDIASFGAKDNRLIPYREFKLKPLKSKPINEIYVGPKNITPNFVIDQFLSNNGYTDINIIRSSATYR